MIRKVSGPVLPLSARRAYFQFMAHITKSTKAGVEWPVHTFTEFGVGTTLGIGCCALISGVRRYQGFDLIQHLNLDEQDSTISDILSLFKNKAPAINDQGQIAFEFPSQIISESILRATTTNNFICGLRKGVASDASKRPSDWISYAAPYDQSLPEYFGTSDYVMSTATLEHVEDLSSVYLQFHELLRLGGVMSHSIDLRCHGYRKPWNQEDLWNGHWLLTEDEWGTVTAGQEYSINRAPASQHLKLIVESGFEILSVQKRVFKNKLKWNDLAPRFQWMTPEDIECSGLHVIARKI